MPDAGTYPTPIAVPLARSRATNLWLDVTEAAADAGYAIVKYVALLRLADWIRSGMPGQSKTLVSDANALLDGPSATNWWRASSALETLTRAAPESRACLPRTPRWSAIGQEAVDKLNRARRSRHDGTRPEGGAFAQGVRDVVDELLDASAPLLELPLVRVRPPDRDVLRGVAPIQESREACSLAVEVGGQDLTLDPFFLVLGQEEGFAAGDVYLYEKMTQRGYLVADADRLRERAGHPAPIRELRQWVDLRRRDEERFRASDLGNEKDEAIEERLRRAVTDARARDWRGASLEHEPRADVRAALDGLGAAGIRALVLVGASGVGKTREVTEWLTRTTRVPLLVRAFLWQGQHVELLLGTAAMGGASTALPLDRLNRLATDRSLAIAIDGVNETIDPPRLLRTVVEGIRRIQAPVHLVLTTRPEGLDKLLPLLDPSWLYTSRTGRPNVLEVGPLSRLAAESLWDKQRPSGASTFTQLDPATQRLFQVPIMLALARGATLQAGSRVGADAVVERFVECQTGDRERVLLRQIAARMVATKKQMILCREVEGTTPADVALRGAFDGTGAFAEAFRALQDKGLLSFSGSISEGDSRVVAFGHDRLLQWFAGRWLVAQERASTPRRLSEEVASWTERFRDLVASPALSSSVGQAIAIAHGDSPLLLELLRSNDAHARSGGSTALRALGEHDTTAAASAMRRAWGTFFGRRQLRRDVVALAAELGDAEMLAAGVRHRRTKDTAVQAITRIRRHSPAVVHESISRLWGQIRRWPWLHPILLGRITALLVYATIAEGAARKPDPALTDLASTVAVGVLGTGRGQLGRWLRRGLLEVVTFSCAQIIRAVPPPSGWFVAELTDFLRTDVATRTSLEPLVDVFAGTRPLAEIRPLAEAIVVRPELGPLMFLERALMRAALRPGMGSTAMNLAFELGLSAQRQRRLPPVAAAQSMMYVMLHYLVRNPENPSWDRHYEQFSALFTGWLAVSPKRRFVTSRGHHIPSTWTAGHSWLWHVKHGSFGCPIIQDMWDYALRRDDEALMLDLVDEVLITAISQLAPARALCDLEPLLRADRMPRSVHRRTLYLLRAIRDRDPAELERALSSGPGENRRKLAGRVALGRAEDTEGYSFLIHFDDALMFNDAFTDDVIAILRSTLTATSMRALLSFISRRLINRITKRSLFPEIA